MNVGETSGSGDFGSFPFVSLIAERIRRFVSSAHQMLRLISFRVIYLLRAKTSFLVCFSPSNPSVVRCSLKYLSISLRKRAKGKGNNSNKSTVMCCWKVSRRRFVIVCVCVCVLAYRSNHVKDIRHALLTLLNRLSTCVFLYCWCHSLSLGGDV